MNTFDGDVKLISTEDGGDILFVDGQPEMDPGLSTAAFISAFTDEGWWGNAISDPAEQIGSKLETLFLRTLTPQAMLDGEGYLRDALQWMIDQGIADDVVVSSDIPAVGQLRLKAAISQPGIDDPVEQRYILNWEAQSVILEAA